MKIKHKHKKAAFQLSLGFIITVVFAIVLLGIGLIWLRSTFIGIEGLTNDLTQQARASIDETFRETARNFAVFPSKYVLSPSDSLILSAGIKNDDQVASDLNFVINVVPASASTNVVDPGCSDPSRLTCTVVGQTQTAQQLMAEWISFDTSSIRIQNGGQGFRDITLKPSQAPAGDYTFSVFACKGPDITTYSGCTGSTLNHGGSAQQVTITLVI